jgi:2,3-bisphosphoglycerate-independent phosphoglycerate mutase
MVGHTGKMDAVVKALQKLDTLVGQIIDFCKLNKYELLVTSDHGNCEEM